MSSEVTTAQRGDDEPESVQAEESSNASAFETAEEQFDYWMEQFRQLADRAEHDGLCIVVCASMHDPINKEAHWNYAHRGSTITNLGLLELVHEDFKLR